MALKQILKTLMEFEGKGEFSFVAETTKESLKKSRETQDPTPKHLLEITVIKAATVSLGNDYEDAVNKRLVKEGKVAEFVSEETYCVPVSKNLLVYKHKEKNQFYLRVYPNLCHSFKTIIKRYDLNGKEITDAKWAKIEEEYFPLRGKNKSQGLKDQILVNNYKLENVKFLKRGIILIDELTRELIEKLSEE